MIREALEYLSKQIVDRTWTETIFEDQEIEIVLISDPEYNGEERIHTFNKTRAPLSHTFTDIGGFVSYMKSGHVDPKKTVVFVNANQIEATLNYKSIVRDIAKLPLIYSEEYTALLQCATKWKTAKELWRVLIADLKGCIDAELMLQVMNLRAEKNHYDELRIDQTGLTESDSKKSVKISYRSGKDATEQRNLGIDYIFTGRVYDCFDLEVTIPFRLELSDEDGLKFKFHPERIRTIEREHVMRLVSNLKESLPEFSIYEGSHSNN